MKLKTFEHVNTSSRTEYVVFDQNNNFIESFYVDYLNENGEIDKDFDLNESILKREKYKNANVVYVSVNLSSKRLRVSLTITVSPVEPDFDDDFVIRG